MDTNTRTAKQIKKNMINIHKKYLKNIEKSKANTAAALAAIGQQSSNETNLLKNLTPEQRWALQYEYNILPTSVEASKNVNTLSSILNKINANIISMPEHRKSLEETRKGYSNMRNKALMSNLTPEQQWALQYEYNILPTLEGSKNKATLNQIIKKINANIAAMPEHKNSLQQTRKGYTNMRNKLTKGGKSRKASRRRLTRRRR